MKTDLKNQDFESIKIRNTSLIGATLDRCNLSRSVFENLDISGMNLNGASLFNCIWKNIRIHQLNKFEGHDNSVNSVHFSTDGTTLASCSRDCSVRLWDVKTGQQKAKFCYFNNDLENINAACLSPNGNTIAIGSVIQFKSTIQFWDVKTRKKKLKLYGKTSTAYSICFSPDGTTLASGGADKSICLWDVKNGKQKAKLNGHSNGVISVYFSPDGTILASGQQKQKFDGHRDGVLSVQFSPDGTTLAFGSSDNSIRLWDVQTGKQKEKLDGHNNVVYSVCFSSDGTALASGSDDKSIRIWDVKTGQKVYTYDQGYKDNLAKFKIHLFQNNSFSQNVNDNITNITVLLISKYPIFQAQRAQVLKGEFLNHFGLDLRQLFRQRGSIIVDSQIKIQKINIDHYQNYKTSSCFSIFYYQRNFPNIFSFL